MGITMSVFRVWRGVILNKLSEPQFSTGEMFTRNAASQYKLGIWLDRDIIPMVLWKSVYSFR